MDEEHLVSKFLCSICCIGCLLTCILIPLSIQNVDYSEYGIAYNMQTCTADKEVFNQGKHFVGIATTMFRYNRIVVTTDFTGPDGISCLTSDGIQIELDITFQYQIIKGELLTIFMDFGMEAELQDFLKVTARDSIRDTCATKTAQNFYEQRGGIEQDMTAALVTDVGLARAHVDIRLFQLKNVELPIELKTAIEEKQRSEQDIDNAENERAGALINAQTKLETAKVEAATVIIVAEAEATAVLTEAEERSTAITQVFKNRGSVYKLIMQETGLTATTFVTDYLYGVIVGESEKPILAM